MHKRFFAGLTPFILLSVVAILAISKISAESSPSWINSALAFQKQADTQSVPNSIDGNIDCFTENDSSCSVPTAYGAATHGGTVRLNGSSNFYPVMSFIDNRQRFLPIPNSSGFITFTTEPAIGAYLYFNYDFNSAVKIVRSFGQTQYQVIKPLDGVLEDQSNNRLAADISSIAFSQNGQWVVISMPGAAMLRVNLQTFEVLPFAPGFDYNLGLDPAPKTAITNDGRYAVVASKNFNRLKIYDLATCNPAPAVINGTVTCQSRDLQDFMQQHLPGYLFTSYIRFLDDNTLSAYSTYISGTTSKTARILISTTATTDQIDYLALGDSYISGEGAFDYQGGTDTDTNMCHVSLLAYPYLLGHDLNYNSYHSVACSGAITSDITDTSDGYKGQADNKKFRRVDRHQSEIDSISTSFKPGYIDQMDFVSRYQPRIINLSIGGNDMGFSEIVKSCAMSIGTCYNTYEDRLELVREIQTQVFPKLVQTYQKLKSAGPPDMRFYVISYPQIAKPGGDCALNVRLNNDEIVFSQQLISYLDSVVQAAAKKAGVYYVDTQDALNGHRLCEAGPGSVAINGFTLGNDRPSRLGGPIGDESYHPNNFGYQLLENKILQATHNLTDDMPAPDPAAAPPSETGTELLNADHSGRPVSVLEYDPAMADDLVYPDRPFSVSLGGAEHSLVPNTKLRAEVHSDPVQLGSFTTESTSNLSAEVSLPATLPSGYHTLHFYGTDINGQSIDIYKYIFLAANPQGFTAAISLSTGSEPSVPGETTTAPTQQIKNRSSANSQPTTQQTVPSQILGEETESLPVNHFSPGWLLAAMPASLSILYLARNKQ